MAAQVDDDRAKAVRSARGEDVLEVGADAGESMQQHDRIAFSDVFVMKRGPIDVECRHVKQTQTEK
jgi:hypothetical protein